MATIERLEAERKQTLAEIKRRGGKDKAPGFAKKLQEIDLQLKPMRKEAEQQQQPSPEQDISATAPGGSGLSKVSAADWGFWYNALKSGTASFDSIAKEYTKQFGTNISAQDVFSTFQQVRQTQKPYWDQGDNFEAPPSNGSAITSPGNVTPGGTSMDMAGRPTLDPNKGTSDFQELADLKDDTLQDEYDDGSKIADTQTSRGNLTKNPNVYGPLGYRVSQIDPDTGQIITNFGLSDEQQGILNQGQAMTLKGQQMADQLMEGYKKFEGGEALPDALDSSKYSLGGTFEQDPNDIAGSFDYSKYLSNGDGFDASQYDAGYSAFDGSQYETGEGPFDASQYGRDQGKFTTGQGAGGIVDSKLAGYQGFQMGGDPEAERSRVEDAVFKRLSRGMDVRQKQAKDELEQSLADRGIQFSADPNSRYQQEIKALEQSQQEERQSYEQQAVQMGGEEYARDYGIAQSTYQQGMSDLGQMYGMSSTTRQQQQSDIGQQFAQDIQGYQQGQADVEAKFGRGLSSKQQGMSERSQRYGEALQGYQQGQADKAQDADIALKGYAEDLVGQAQRYGQKLSTRQQQASELQDTYTRDTGALKANLERQQQGFDQRQAVHRQTMSDMSALQGQGTGLMMPNYTEAQGSDYDLLGAIGAAQSSKQTGASVRTTDAAIAKLKESSSGTSDNTTPSPFV